MSKELIILRTHIIDEGIINEYSKLAATGKECLLMIDNNENIFIDHGGGEGKCKIYNHNIHYFLTYASDYKVLKLPFYANTRDADYKTVMWYNCDYALYLIRKIFPDYDIYWQFEYDVYLNGNDYMVFFEKYMDPRIDLYITNLQKPLPGKWCWLEKSEWMYSHEQSWACLFSTLRITAEAIDFLYNERIKQSVIFDYLLDNNKVKDVRWLFCEIFATTALKINGFNCKAIDTERIAYGPYFSEPFYKKKLYLSPDGLLYHPIKDHSFICELS